MSVVVSVRIPKHLKEKLERYGIDVPELIRSKLVEEVERIEKEEIRRLLDELKSSLQGKIDPHELSKLVEEGRRER
jgi:Ca2+-binding EF-hand superfamily protein